MKNYLRFAGRVTAGHVVTYAGVGVLAYAFVTGEFFDGANELVKRVMRTPAEPALWSHVTRGMRIPLALYPFLEEMRRWTYGKQAPAIVGKAMVEGAVQGVALAAWVARPSVMQ